ncbi:MAG: TAXI family TRAP transporter solute-binding subunit [Planctomycetaceae bacterium]|nr:TAXI family TRAP transporter solute-binding subunit [Planctomycetaceae bacterium]
MKTKIPLINITAEIPSKITTRHVRKWVSLSIVMLFVSSLLMWFFGRTDIPDVILIATGEQGGLYHKFGEYIQIPLERRLDRPVKLLSTEGSVDNFRRVRQGEVTFGIVQGGAVAIEELSVVTPLFPDFVFVIVRSDGEINDLSDLAGSDIALGRSGSGSRISALQVLEHFDIHEDDLGDNDRYFMDLLDDPSLEGAIMTTGIENPDLHAVLSGDRFKLLPVLNAEAIELAHPFFRKSQIPRGYFGDKVPIPSESITTITTNAFLVTKSDTPREIVRHVLGVVHEESLKQKVPTLISREDATAWTSTKLHPAANEYFNPSNQIGWVRDILESVTTMKELLVAMGTGIYLLWRRWKRLKEEERNELRNKQRDRLDWFLSQTLLIEQAQMNASDIEELQEYLDKVTTIKLEALQELTEAEMRSDLAFSIFLDQCASLINKIQLKILDYHAE